MIVYIGILEKENGNYYKGSIILGYIWYNGKENGNYYTIIEPEICGGFPCLFHSRLKMRTCGSACLIFHQDFQAILSLFRDVVASQNRGTPI